jgi:hypothetical protein
MICDDVQGGFCLANVSRTVRQSPDGDLFGLFNTLSRAINDLALCLHSTATLKWTGNRSRTAGSFGKRYRPVTYIMCVIVLRSELSTRP